MDAALFDSRRPFVGSIELRTRLGRALDATTPETASCVVKKTQIESSLQQERNGYDESRESKGD